MRTLRRWWWIPLVALIGIFLKATLLTPWVAGKAEDAALAALAAENLGAVDFVEVDGVDGFGGDGLNVTLEGPAADEAAAVAAVEARDEIDNVFYRQTAGAAAVADEDPAEQATSTDEPAEEAVEEEPAAPTLEPVNLGLVATGGAMVLQGTVADEAARSAIVAEAEAAYGATNVTDELVIGEDVAGRGGVITLTGEAASDGQKTELLAAGTAVASVAGLEVVDQITVRSVEMQLNDLFALEPIEFDVNRATIRDASVATLDAAAMVITDNPEAGRLRVVGHTDGDGSESANQALSEARAASVMAYLVDTGQVDPDRLEAEGRGESQLLVSPEVSRADRQRNRRIEWELIS